MEELVSVIVPVYKVEKYLDRCILSIVNQTYINLEIILVDDGSPDGCPGICDRWQEKDGRIQVIHRENGGLSAARNSGIAAAKGEYIALVDSDDFIAEDFIDTLLTACRETDSDMAQCRYEYVSGDRLTKDKAKVEPTEVFTGKEMIGGMSWRDGAYNVVAWNKLYRRSLFAEITYPEGRIHEDEATTHKLFYQAKKVAFVYRYLYGYFTGGSSITRDSFSYQRLDWEWAVSSRLDFLREHQEWDLMIPMYKLYMDGTIDLYYKTLELLKDKERAEELRGKMRHINKELRKKGGTPFVTKMGYEIFLACPRLYKKLIGR